MGCSSSRQSQVTRTSSERLARRRSSNQVGVCFPRVEDDDDVLASMDLPLNDEIQEDMELTEPEKKLLADRIVARLADAETYASLDETSKIRIFRGLIVNNSGTQEERIAEAIEVCDRVCAFQKERGAAMLSTPLPKEEIVNKTMNTVIGGEDLYGHLVWAERLGDVAGLVDHPVSVAEIKRVRLKLGETIRAAQIRSCEGRGPRRYKQVYIVDLSELALGSLMGRAAVREMAKSIISGAGDFFPETLWKLFIVNAPFIFRSAYGMVSPFIHPITKQKIQILGGKSTYMAALKKAGVLPGAIPKSLGGTREDKPVADCLAELVADGFPRAQKKWVDESGGRDASASARSRGQGPLRAVPEDEPVRKSFLEQAAFPLVIVAGVVVATEVAIHAL